MKFSGYITFLFCSSVIVLLMAGCERAGNYHVRTETLRIDSLQQITLLTGVNVKPMLYTNISGLKKLPAKKAKDLFISAVLPSILVAKHEMEHRRRKITGLQKNEKWNRSDSVYVNSMQRRYGAKDINDLLARIGTLPSSIVLAQAAVESGWGTSRFFLEANNLFGVWSFNEKEPRIMARHTRESKRIYLRSYPDIAQSIIDYFEILARSASYKSLRMARLKTNDVDELLPHLRNYSERRKKYVRQLKKVIAGNHLVAYDEYHIDPDFLVED